MRLMISSGFCLKQLIFMDASGQHYPQHPVLPTSSAGTGGNVTNIGAQIGVWYSR